MFGKSPLFSPSSWKQGWHNVGKQRYYFRSSWEVAVAQYLESQGWDWRYELKRYKLSDQVTYVPDFFILVDDEIERIIEVKGWMKPKDQLKINLFVDCYSIPLEVWGRQQLKDLGILDGSGYGKIS